MSMSHSVDNRLIKAEDEEETDSSSSFDDSEYEEETDSEVVSYVFGDFLQLRTKKLTSHWKNFIKPLMWKCKWLELQIKKCNSQALKYDNELAAYSLRKDFESGNCSNEGYCARTLPFSSGDTQRDKIMHRNKRIKIEGKSDTMPSVSNLVLFSCDEGKHNDTQEKIRGDYDDDEDERLWLYGDDNDPIEGVLRKFETLKSKVSSMRTQLNKVVTNENGGKLSSNNDLGFPVPSSVRSVPVQSRLSQPIDMKPIVDEPEQPSNNEPPSKTRSLAQLFPPPRHRKRR